MVRNCFCKQKRKHDFMLAFNENVTSTGINSITLSADRLLSRNQMRYSVAPQGH